MHFRFLLADQYGDIELCAEELRQPFLLSPTEKHPFLTLADYFGALEKFLTQDDGRILHFILNGEQSRENIDEIVIRSEKHGAFYHIASFSLTGRGGSKKFAVTTAISEPARLSLAEEIGILQQLSDIAADFIPEIYCHGTVKWETESDEEKFLMVLGEWLSGYHEWHASEVPGTGEYKIKLWDYENGYRFLDDAETFALLQQAAYILTYYYDQASYRQIYPWHHGAGDFIAKCESGETTVKLITARQYEPLVDFDQYEEADNLVAAIHFLLNLTLRMRLDRLDGVGEPVWLDTYGVRAALAGFFAALAAGQKNGRLKIVPAEDFLEIMRSFNAAEILEMYASLLEIYADEDQDDFNLIREKIGAHSEELQQEIQNLELRIKNYL